jgi:hypothetical protein
VTPNIFATYFAAQLSGHPPKWQPVDTLSVQFESGKIVGLTYYSKHFELSPDIEIKGVARVAYDQATNTIYYYVPKEEKRGQPPREGGG